MNNCMMIHETIIRDILDVIDDVKDADELLPGISNRSNSFKSIASASSNLTLVFPVIMDRNISIDSASMITKAIERKAVTMLQMLFSALCISDSKDGIEYVKNFHTNLKMDDNLTVDSFIDAMDKFVISKEGALRVSDRAIYEKAKADLSNLNYFLPESVSSVGLDEYKVHRSGYYGESVIFEGNGTTSIDLDGIQLNPTLNVRTNVNMLNGGGSRGGNSLKDRTDYQKKTQIQ